MKKIILNLLKRYSVFFVIEFIFLVLNTYVVTLPLKFLGKIIDLINDAQQNKTEITNLVLLLLGASLLILVVRIIWKMVESYISRNMVKNLREISYKKLLKIDNTTLNSIKNGEIMTYFVKDIKEIDKFITYISSLIIRLVFNFIVIGIIINQSSSLKLMSISMAPILISVILIMMLSQILEKNYQMSRKQFTELSNFVQENTDSIRTTKAYVGEEVQYEQFYKQNTNLKNINFKISKLDSLLNNIIAIGIGFSIGLFILFGSKDVLNNQISVGDFVAVNGYLVLMASPICWVPWVMKHCKKVKVSYNRLNTYFNLPEEKITISNNNEEKLKGEIEIKNLTFCYPNCIEPVLEDIDISIKPGKSLGIIGTVGSGKTTLMNLITKLYQVPNNHIFIDGKDINEIKINTIRNNICYITQDNFLFSATLKENINLFRDIYDEEDIINSTQKSMIYNEIENMNDGIETIVGEKGIDLSGGQKQRVAISRAFLKDSNILIFDDTFSALDNRTEQSLLGNLKEFTQEKTCIIVSNRISDIRHCDEIVVLEHGKIVERGVHNSLIKNKKYYYNFYKNQAEKSNLDFLV